MSEPESARNGRTLRDVDDEAIALAARLLDSSRHGTLAVLDPGSGHPLASRTALASDADGAPLILVSRLAAHTAALEADARCSLLVGEPGTGDPLAYPRMTLIGRARRLERASPEGQRSRERFLAAHPKSALYADFADFSFWRIEIQRASLNGGFGRAWLLEGDALRRALSAVRGVRPA
jgi:putative heme iron utilization protein